MPRNARVQGAAIGAIAALLALVLWFSGALQGWENATWTWRVRTLAKPGPSSDEIVLVLLDQKSLDWGQEAMGLPWPWPREIYGVLIDFCTRAGSRAVAFDVVYTEPSVYGVYDDETLGSAISRNGSFVGARFLAFEGVTQEISRIDEPIPEVAENAALLANVSEIPDADGVFRRASLWLRTEEDRVPSLGTAAWLIGQKRDLSPDLATDALLRFRGGTSEFTNFNAAEIIRSELLILEGGDPDVDPERLRDKYVLFGFSAPGLLDLRPTPVGHVTPGILVHATALDNLLSDDFMHETPTAAVIAGTLALALLAGGIIVGATGVAATVLWSALLLLLPMGIGLATYAPGLWWPVLPGTVAVLGALFGGLARNYAVEGRQRRFIKSAFRHYLSPAVIERILDDPDALRLGGERRTLTIMFSDLAGFTSLSEGMEPEELTELLNDYLTDMTDIILEEGGTLDKYEGDAIIAFWNAPLTQDDHAARACRAAVRCQRQLLARRGEFLERSGRELHARIGLHTGDVIVGNMGSRQRFDYTIIGDAANLASRLEGANKVFATETMISDATCRAAAASGDAFLARQLGDLRVVGRREPVLVHELHGLPGDDAPAHWAPFAAALDRCRAGALEEALAKFEELADDPAASAYRARCDAARNEDEPFVGLWNLVNK